MGMRGTGAVLYGARVSRVNGEVCGRRTLTPVIDSRNRQTMICAMPFPAAAHILLLLFAGMMASCASGPATGITRVKIYRLDPGAVPEAAEPSIPFEQKHFLYGAVTDADREARRGNYYTIFFRPPDRTQPVRARFEYRQAATGFAIHVKDLEVAAGRGMLRFSVTGQEFEQRGRLLGWRVTLTQAGRVFGERKSYLWD